MCLWNSLSVCVQALCSFMAAKSKKLCFVHNPHPTPFIISAYFQAWYDSSLNNCQKTWFQLSCHPYSIHTLTHLSASLSSSLPHELPLPSLHPSLTSHMPPTPPPCQLTPEHGHIVLPFDPLPGCRSTQDPRPAASVLVCYRALSHSSVIDGPRWAALTHRAAALTWMVWGSIDYDATCDRGESGLSWWWQGEDKRGRGYGWGAVS